MEFERRLANVEKKLRDQATQNDACRDTMKAQDGRIEELGNKLRERYPSPLLQLPEDIALVEGIFSILAAPRKDHKTGDMRPIVSQFEIAQYIDKYRLFWTAVVHILVDKGITTAKELNCEMLAFHHFMRMEGLNTDKSKDELFTARRKYVEELMAMRDPLEMIGR